MGSLTTFAYMIPAFVILLTIVVFVHEFGGEVPARLHGSGERIIHQAGILDRLGGGKQLVERRRRLQLQFIE